MLDYVQMVLLKLKNQRTDSIVEITEKELQMRNQFDEFACALSSRSVANVNKLLENNQITVKELDLAMKCNLPIEECWWNTCYQIKRQQILKQKKEKTIEAMESFSGEEIDEFAQGCLALMRAKFQKTAGVEEYVKSKVNKRWFNEFNKFYVKIYNPMGILDCIEVWEENPALLSFMSDDVATKVGNEVAEYFCDYSDDNVTTLVTRFLVNSIIQKTGKVQNLESLIEFVNEKIQFYGQYGITVNDRNLINYALGGCKEALELR